ncbi:MAG: TraM recognition domain-containing protein, partial [Candidatus Thermoplasmatota archaeon]|nr:TraM recognition domain-containing protein [Candidatus Thermoplasmatota archaeon]
MHNVGRDYKITSLSCLQSKSQLNADYGKDRADAILAGYRYKWFFSSIDPAARDYAKRVLGTEQEIVEDEKLGKMPRIYHLYTDREWR